MVLIVRMAAAVVVIAAFAALALWLPTSPWAPLGHEEPVVEVKTEQAPPPLATTLPELPGTPPEKNAPKGDTGGTKPKPTPVETPQETPQVSQPLPTPVTSPTSFGEINTKTREALVNIYCSTKTGGVVKPISGSGIIIDSRGIILTNAHIAQYYLLQNFPVKDSLTCAIRTGSPAREMYRAELVYFPSKWLDAHAKDIMNPSPTGTGENDYALLRITERLSGAPLPSSFPFISMDASATLLAADEQMLVAGYPAEFVGSIASLRDLYITSTISSVKKIFTFGNDTPDLLNIVGSLVAQKGASGGAVVGKNGQLVGLVVTATDQESTGSRELNAISMSHINRSVIAHAGKTMSDFLSREPALLGTLFKNNEAPLLTKKLTDAIEAAVKN